jgi:phage major head subunit gpT-like protein
MKRSDIAKLLEPGIRKVLFDNYNALTQKYDKVFHVLSSDKAQEEDISMSGIGLLDEAGEGDITNYEDPSVGYPVSYVHKKFKKGIKISEEAYDDEKYNQMNKQSKNLGVAANRTVEVKAASILNNAFGTTVATGGDGKALCADNHPRLDGGAAQSNVSNMDLAEDAIETAKLAMRATLDDKGQKIVVMPSAIIVPAKLQTTAQILIKSKGRTGTEYTNEINVNENTLEIIDWDYLTSDTAWFMIDKAIHELNFFWRKKLTLQKDNSVDTDEFLWKVKMRFSVGFSNWRGFWGSTGTNE